MSETISQTEINYLRDLAKKQAEYADHDIMKQREKEWYALNSLKSEKPMVIMEMASFRDDLLPPLRCQTQMAKELEMQLLMNTINYEKVNDDKVMPNFINVKHKINMRELNIKRHIHRAKDGKGRAIGYAMEHPITDLKDDFHLIERSVYNYDEKYTKENYDFVNELIGDILPIRLYNDSLRWFISLTARIVNIMGLERLMYSMIDYPLKTHELFDFITTDSIEYIMWQQENNLLTLDNGNHLAGAGSFGFTNELPTEQYKKTKHITTKDLWINMNSQESVGISASMYKEFVYPSFKRVAKLFGLTYYGCCEPVHEIWETSLSDLPNLRKVSISPWCDEHYMGQQLKDSKIIYSRKPSPNYIGVGQFDEPAFREHIAYTLDQAKGCQSEIIFRDIYTLTNEPWKAKRAVEVVREQIEKQW